MRKVEAQLSRWVRVLLEVKGVTREDYGLRHHGGYLGRAARIDNVPH